jgi:hypothetical protein
VHLHPKSPFEGKSEHLKKKKKKKEEEEEEEENASECQKAQNDILPKAWKFSFMSTTFLNENAWRSFG